MTVKTITFITNHSKYYQALETTPNRQQCVKVAVETSVEYFFVLAQNVGDPSTMVYLHQTLNTLCIHKMDENVIEDQINTCATNMAGMNGYGETVSELYVCTNYLKEEGKMRNENYIEN